MNRVTGIIKQHPRAFVACLVFGLMVLQSWRVTYRFREESNLMDEGNKVAFGEGVAYTILFTILIGIVIVIIALILAAFRKKQRKFYLLLSLPIIITIALIIFVWGT